MATSDWAVMMLQTHVDDMDSENLKLFDEIGTATTVEQASSSTTAV